MNGFDFDSPREHGFLPPMITYVLCGLCGFVFVLQMMEGNGSSGGLAYPGFVDGLNVIQGEYWGLLTTFFLHGDFLHIAFNVYWLYRFGTAVEPYIGWKRFALFWVIGTALSSAVEVEVSGNTGIGASGFVYALFGLIWIGGRTDHYLARIVDNQVVVLFIVWLFLCMGLTWTGVWAIANAAHVGGLAFGCLCGYAFINREEENRSIRVTASAITILAFLPLFYAPWSSTWNLAQAEKAYEGQKYERALSYFDRVHLKVYEGYVAYCRADGLTQLGRTDEAVAAYKELFSIADTDLANSASYNSYAWILATTSDDKVRDPQEAIRYALMACEKDDYKDSAYIDTLAAAYASAKQFDQAVQWQQKALALNQSDDLVKEMKERLSLYQTHQTYRDPAPRR